MISPRLAKRLSDALQQFCFPAGTEIAVAGGSKGIEEIEVGEMVWAQSDRTGEVELKRVKQLFVNVAASLVVITAGTNTIEATDEHPFWVVDQGWKAAGQVQVGDELWARSGERIRVTEVGHKKGQFTVYNFEVEDAHTYFVSKVSVLVHNANGCTPSVVYRMGSDTPKNLTPRPPNPATGHPGDVEGLSTKIRRPKDKSQSIDTSKLEKLEAVKDGNDHVSIRPKDMARMQEWIDTRGTDTIHEFTEELIRAIIK